MYITDEHFEGDPLATFADIDDLLYQWKQFVNEELQEFKIIKSDLFGTGCVCDLKTMFENNNTEPEFAMELMPRVKDCASECLYIEYTTLIGNFLGQFTNMNGAPMTIVDLGNDEIYFYNAFEKVARTKAIWNIWDLWRIPENKNTK
jgi:hypothetical protein